MSGEIIETTAREVKNELMSVSGSDIEQLGKHLENIKKFVKEQLKEGINNDYAVIPGTPKKSLLKPGAEKLLKLFGLSSRVECVDKVISFEENFVMFTYRATIIHIKSGTEISQCEGMCTNLEKKYREKKSGELINSQDIVNTLMKMAQKRAIVGATIIATAASDYFTQDEDEIENQATKKNQTVDSSKFTQDSSADNSGNFQITFGKHKGKKFNQLKKEELTDYVNWIKDNNANPNGPMKELLDAARVYLRAA